MEAIPGVDLITHYFPQINEQQQEQFAALAPLYFHWNQQINVISRQDIHSIYLKHVLHSLGIAKVMPFKDATSVLDVGTGGGFPGIPLAIMFPRVRFHLVDSIGKKVKVVQEISRALQLNNISSEQIRAEQVNQRFEYIVSRAVTRVKSFTPWVARNLKKNGHMLFLKGGDLHSEIAESNLKIKEYALSAYFDEPFFESKKVLSLAYPEIRKKFLIK